MTQNKLPGPQGLYHPSFEHDACGIGVIADVKGRKSHDHVQQALEILTRLTHRGGKGSDGESGDGAGILTQIPHDLFVHWSKQHGIHLPNVGEYGVAMLFLPVDEALRNEYEQKLEQIVKREGMDPFAWRTVPVNEKVLGSDAKLTKPMIRQLFVKRAEQTPFKDEISFERVLYMIRKQAEHEIRPLAKKQQTSFYFASFSARTIVYKGLMLPDTIQKFYLDLQNPDYKSAIALVHSRYSTNTFPSWERAHPNRYAIHNGEINTITGNVNWMRAREAKFESDAFPDLSKIKPIIDDEGSDSSMLDQALEFFVLSGRSLAHTMMMMNPEPWVNDEQMNATKRAFYAYHSCFMEPWDGPAAIAFTDGYQVGACLDRNGLRPSRYYVTKDDKVILSSEVGVIDLPPERVLYKERLHPGQMLLVDTKAGRIIPDDEIKLQVANEHPYKQWIDENLMELDQLPLAEAVVEKLDGQRLQQTQQAFGYTFEELQKVIKPLAEQGQDPVGSMGYDGPLAVLSDQPQLLYNYFKQLFAQVTNPPIDALLEEMVTSMEITIGAEGNLLQPVPEHCRRIKLKYPVLSNEQLERIRSYATEGFRATTLSMTFPVQKGAAGLEQSLHELFSAADQAIEEGATILVLSDRQVDAAHAPIPALLASAGLHHHLIRRGTRTSVSIIVESAEPREVHHLALLLGYGAQAVNPYLVFETIESMRMSGTIREVSQDVAVKNYIKGTCKGILKVMAKMGISTVQSYIGAQIFEAIGINQEVIDKYFTWTPSRIGGIGLDTIAAEVIERHEEAYAKPSPVLKSGDDFWWRKGGETKLFSPQAIHAFQEAVRTNNYDLYKRYSEEYEGKAQQQNTLRGLLDFVPARKPIPLHEVEPIENIMKRFKTGAMSFGSISKEAHETLAIAMNRIGGKSNSGEGGEDPERFVPDENGDRRISRIKQVASGRFGVTSYYLNHADEIQIKMAQGAKPGEGGQLPAHKVYPWVAKARGSTPGVELISPPPHHDIYSIEDLAELIYDLKNANPKADINVKLVSKAGVGTIAAGVAKANADVILISGYDGGTGAAARGSIKHAGMPWEIGLAETHQTLVLNGLRDRVRLETDGKMMTGRDVIVAAMLGAEEYGFSTLPLVAMGCVMMRVCHLDTCPVGIATQNPELRAKFPGKPEHVVNFMHFVAQEVREWMAKLGVRTLDELIGRSDLLKMREDIPSDKKAAKVDLSKLLYQPEKGTNFGIRFTKPQDHGLESTLDRKKLVPLSEEVLQGRSTSLRATLEIRNTDRAVGAILGSEVTNRFGAEGLPEDTIQFDFKGSAGQSLGAFMPKGITMTVEGDANDYFGKGLSGGKLIVYPPEKSTFVPADNIIIGNVAFYGATSGEAYICGVAGERFCVRNSGANVVVEGVGNHGCEYMTGGRVIILGNIGKNFAAGMSGGIAYIWNQDVPSIERLCNQQLVNIEKINEEESVFLREQMERHLKYTGSARAKMLLSNWDQTLRQFVRIIPREYKRIIEQDAKQKALNLQSQDNYDLERNLIGR